MPRALIGPGSIPWEIGNAFSAMLRQRRLGVAEAQQGLKIFHAIPLRFVRGDLKNAISIANQTKAYAYDAYFLDCALRHVAPPADLGSQPRTCGAETWGQIGGGLKCRSTPILKQGKSFLAS